MICASLSLISCQINKQPGSFAEENASAPSSIIVTPKEVIRPAEIQEKIAEVEISYEDNEQNGGIITFDENGWNITEKALNKYNKLINEYSKDFSPPLAQNDGVSIIGGKIYLSQEYMIKFAIMNTKKKDILND